jgi:hypothetical protein
MKTTTVAAVVRTKAKTKHVQRNETNTHVTHITYICGRN